MDPKIYLFGNNLFSVNNMFCVPNSYCQTIVNILRAYIINSIYIAGEDKIINILSYCYELI